VPLFLEQLAATLKAEQTTTARKIDTEPAPTPTAIGRARGFADFDGIQRGVSIPAAQLF